jgi:hypothetical protein
VTLTDDVRDGLVDLEERFWLEGGGNPSFWRRHLADDGLVALPLGIMDKDQTVRAIAQASPWARVEMRDVRVLAVSDDSALVTYTAVAARAEDTDDYIAVIGSVYVLRGGAWALIFHQQSPMAAPA